MIGNVGVGMGRTFTYGKARPLAGGNSPSFSSRHCNPLLSRHPPPKGEGDAADHVYLDIWLENQDGDKVIVGKASVPVN